LPKDFGMKSSVNGSSLKGRQRIILWSGALLGIAILAAVLAWAAVHRKTADEYIDRALALAGEGDEMGAVAELTEGINRHPTAPDLYYVRANLKASLELDRQAIEDYTEAIRLKLGFGLAHLNRASSYARTEHPDLAIEDYGLAIHAFDPGIPTNVVHLTMALSRRGDLHARRGEYDLAIKDYTEAIRLDPQDAEACRRRGNAYVGKGDLPRAIADFGAAIKIDPRNPVHYTNRAAAYRASGDRARAESDEEKVAELKK
jgi:tetratricopeptide (TPR) repeat protein